MKKLSGNLTVHSCISGRGESIPVLILLLIPVVVDWISINDTKLLIPLIDIRHSPLFFQVSSSE